jgi:hypothetical protein
MKISVNEDRDIELREVYNGIGLVTRYNETFDICMRDTGFEFQYNNIWYEAKEGKIKKLSKASSQELIKQAKELITDYIESPVANQENSSALLHELEVRHLIIKNLQNIFNLLEKELYIPETGEIK